MEEIVKWDKQIFLFFNNLGNDFWDPVWLQISSTSLWIPLYAFLIFLLFRSLHWKSFLIVLLFVTANVFLTDQGSVWLFKEQFQRLRPCHTEELIARMRIVKEGCGGWYGFVSSHAANTFGMAVLVGGILRLRYRFALILLLLWASVVSYSRIYVGVHYPLDIICGGLYGALCGFLLLKIFLKTGFDSTSGHIYRRRPR